MPKYGENITMEVYGESHGECIGVVINGLPIGLKIDLEKLQKHTDRRKAVNSAYSTKRLEPDKIQIKQGVTDLGEVVGNKVEFVVFNTAQRSSDYANLVTKPRPSHADYPAMVKYGDKVSLAGGGKYSGRLTLPICIAGGIAEQVLEWQGITICSYISEIAGIKGKSYKSIIPTIEELQKAKYNPFYFMGDKISQVQMVLQQTASEADSVGGIIETVIYGLPVGIGDSLFDGIEGRISQAIFGIPAVKGVEFGSGFDLANMKGSTANDQYYYDQNGNVKTYTNNNGGIVGGMTNGSPITIRTVIKPTPSIGLEQKTIDISTNTNTTITIKGRHDVCITPRACAPIESAVAFAIMDILNDR